MKPSIGRIVHFVNENRQHRPAIITKVFNDTMVNLNVFCDANDSQEEKVTPFRTSVTLDEGVDPSVYTFHWPEKI